MKLPLLNEVFMEANPPQPSVPLKPGASTSFQQRSGDRRQLTPPDPSRHATSGQGVVAKLNASTPQSPVMFTTKAGPALIWKQDERYFMRHGKTTFDKSPVDPRGWDENQLNNWMRQVGALSLGESEIKEILGVFDVS